MIHASEAVGGTVYRRTSNPSPGVYYEVATTKAKDTIDKARAHHIRRLEKRGAAIMG